MVNSSTDYKEFYVSVPLRWYFNTANAAYGGAFIEAGPIISRIKFMINSKISSKSNNEQNIDLGNNVKGTSPNLGKWQQSNTTNAAGFVIGIGKTNINDNHQYTYGLALQFMRTLHNERGWQGASRGKFHNNIQGYLSWTF